MTDEEVEKKYCKESGKICFTQKGAADVIRACKKRFVLRKKQIPKRYYKCKYCEWYHLTHYLYKRNTKHRR